MGKRIVKPGCRICYDMLEYLSSINYPKAAALRVLFMFHGTKIITDYTGQKFNKLTVIELVWHEDKLVWLCKCDCGGIKLIPYRRIHKLVSGNTKSCGCLRSGDVDEELVDKRVRTKYEYIQWRKSVFGRDNYTCRLCGSGKGGNLNAHHIYPWKDYKYLRYDVDNGITLCIKCHRSVHSKKYKKQPAVYLFLRGLVKEG